MPERYAAMPGRYFEDFTEGDVYEHLPGRTISQQDNAWFTLLTMNTHPLHFDEEYAAATEFGRPLVASPLTVAIIVGMSVSDVSAKAIANLGWKDIKLIKPVFPGDTLYANTEVVGKRESRSRSSKRTPDRAEPGGRTPTPAHASMSGATSTATRSNQPTTGPSTSRSSPSCVSTSST